MRLIAFDLDGTLLDHNNTVPVRSQEIIWQLRKHGCKIAVITGRHRVPSEVMQSIQPDAISVNNGGIIQVGEQVVAEYPLSAEEFHALNECIPMNADVVAFGEYEVYVRESDREPLPWVELQRALPMSEANGSLIFQVSLRYPAAVALLPELQKLGDFNITGGLAPYEEYLTITPRLANKGQALCDIANAFQIPLSDTIVFGDADNDVAMFQAAGIAIQVGDAACLIDHAHHRVSCSSLGLPKWLEEYAIELSLSLA